MSRFHCSPVGRVSVSTPLLFRFPINIDRLNGLVADYAEDLASDRNLRLYVDSCNLFCAVIIAGPFFVGIQAGYGRPHPMSTRVNAAIVLHRLSNIRFGIIDSSRTTTLLTVGGFMWKVYTLQYRNTARINSR